MGGNLAKDRKEDSNRENIHAKETMEDRENFGTEEWSESNQSEHYLKLLNLDQHNIDNSNRRLKYSLKENNKSNHINDYKPMTV